MIANPVHIYLATNTINGKVYVGQTRKSVAGRWHDHVKRAKAGEGGALAGAIRKYGSGAFTLALIDVLTTADGANRAERAWIAHHDSQSPRGYNLSPGGGQGPHHPTTRTKIGLRSKEVWSDPGRAASIRSAQLAGWRAMTAEERGEGARKRWAAMTPEERREAWRARRAKITPETRATIARDQSERTRAMHASRTPKERGDIIRKAWAHTSPERKAGRAQKMRESWIRKGLWLPCAHVGGDGTPCGQLATPTSSRSARKFGSKPYCVAHKGGPSAPLPLLPCAVCGDEATRLSSSNARKRGGGSAYCEKHKGGRRS